MTTHHSPIVRKARDSRSPVRSGALRSMALLFAFVVASICLPAAAHAAKKPVRVTEQQIARGKKMCVQADKLFAAGKTAEALKTYKQVLAFLPESPWAKRGIAKCQAGKGGGKAPAAGLAPPAPGGPAGGKGAPAGPGGKAAPTDAGEEAGEESGGGLPAPLKGGLALLALVVVFGLVKAVRRKRSGQGGAVVDAPIDSAPSQDATGTPVATAAAEGPPSGEQAAAAAVFAAAAAETVVAEPEASAVPAESATEESPFGAFETAEAPAAEADNPFAVEATAPAEQAAAAEASPFDLPIAAAEERAPAVAEAPAGPFAESPAVTEAKPEEPAFASTFISFAQPEEAPAPAAAPAVPELSAEEKEDLPAAFMPFTEPEAAPEAQAQEEQPAVESAAPPAFAPFATGTAEEPAPVAAAAEEEEAAEASAPPAYSPFGFAEEPAGAAVEAETPTPFGVVEQAEETPSPFGAVSAEEPAAPSPFGAQEEEETPAVFPGLAAAPAAAAGVAAISRESASQRARLWWESAGTNADSCEVCGAVMQRGEGYHLESSEMAASASYVEFDTRMQTMLGLDEEDAAKQVRERLASHAEAWHVCEQCLSQHFDARCNGMPSRPRSS